MTSIKAKFILEILGRPVEHLKQTLTELIDKIGTEKGVAILKNEIHEPKKVEKTEDLWTTFAELDINFETLPIFFNAIMTYLPAHIEVYEPEFFKFNAFELNEFSNFVVSRLHNYDALAKRMISEREILINKLEFLRKGGDPKQVFAPVQEALKEEPKKVKEKKTKKSKNKK